MGLTQKILVFTGLLVVILVGTTVVFTSVQADRLAHEEIAHALQDTKGVWDELTRLHQQAWRTPWDDQVRLRLGELCQKVNRPAEARMWLQAALACNPDNQRARQLLRGN